ncbi:uncharacterized protein VNE69_05114 [Vairimorpha necatrix]|uniref:EF-hand domain-containing protein n=1 Tax=Vairimorpha necatrix TaxID=6039 RepID=A0AAX4JCE5_9MICR
MNDEDYHELFDTEKKGFLTKEESEIYEIFKRNYKFKEEDILNLEINEENLNKLVGKFNLKITKKEIKSMVEYINKK